MSICFTLDLHYVDRHKIGKSNCQSVGLCILSESGAAVRNIDPMKKERKEQAYLQNMSILDENEDKQFEDNFVSENMIRRYKGENRIILQLGLHKRRLWYNFSSYVGSMRLIPKNFRSAALSTATQPW